MSTAGELPDSQIVIKGERVHSITEWVLENGEPVPGVHIERTDEGFKSLIGDPEHGGATHEGEELSDVLSSSMLENYEALFQLTQIGKEDIKELFSDYKVSYL